MKLEGIEHILIDMDGVLVNFMDPALALFGADQSVLQPNQWFFWESLGISEEQFWARVDATYYFWEDLPAYSHFTEILELVEGIGAWSIATAPWMNPPCASQKIRWMRKHIHHRFDRFMIGREKFLLSKPGVVLIDDSDHNVEKFSAGGGVGILFPQKWNSRHDQPVENVQSFLLQELEKANQIFLGRKS